MVFFTIYKKFSFRNYLQCKSTLQDFMCVFFKIEDTCMDGKDFSRYVNSIYFALWMLSVMSSRRMGTELKIKTSPVPQMSPIGPSQREWLPSHWEFPSVYAFSLFPDIIISCLISL